MMTDLRICKNCKHWGVFHWSMLECPGNCNSYGRQWDIRWDKIQHHQQDELLMSELQTKEDFSCDHFEEYDPPKAPLTSDHT